jgi:hypothetical protein
MMQDVELEATESKRLLQAPADVEAAGTKEQEELPEADGARGGPPPGFSVSRRALLAGAALVALIFIVAFAVVAGTAHKARGGTQALPEPPPTPGSAAPERGRPPTPGPNTARVDPGDGLMGAPMPPPPPPPEPGSSPPPAPPPPMRRVLPPPPQPPPPRAPSPPAAPTSSDYDYATPAYRSPPPTPPPPVPPPPPRPAPPPPPPPGATTPPPPPPRSAVVAPPPPPSPVPRPPPHPRAPSRPAAPSGSDDYADDYDTPAYIGGVYQLWGYNATSVVVVCVEE